MNIRTEIKEILDNNNLSYIDKNEWLEETKSIRSYYETIGSKLPELLLSELNQLEERLLKS